VILVLENLDHPAVVESRGKSGEKVWKQVGLANIRISGDRIETFGLT